jgi:hypothetical protein
MEFTTFIRKPFKVQAIEITHDNIAEIAEMIGELRTDDKGTPYISVNRRLVPNIFRAHIGYWVTIMGEDNNIRCLSRFIFYHHFVPLTDEIDFHAACINDEDDEDNIGNRVDEIEEDDNIGNRA